LKLQNSLAMKKKGKLLFQKSKKGKYYCKALTDDGKETSMSGIEIPIEYNEKEAEFILEKGKIIKVIVDNEEFVAQSMNDKIDNKNSKSMKNNNQSQNTIARAPYNFIPLNEKVVEVQKVPDFDKYHCDKYTGYIELEIKTMTPLYIRNTNEKGQLDSDFFNVEGKYKIPGSSLRGMIRTLVEIVSFGKFHYFDDDRFYYRGLADISNLRKYYQEKINKKVCAGYLNYDNKKRLFYIVPAEYINNEQFEKFQDIQKEFHYEEQLEGSWKIWTGKIRYKRNNWIIYPPDPNAQKIELSKEDVSYYLNDKNRTIPIDIIESAKKGFLIIDGKKKPIRFKEGVPIFYVKYKDSKDNERIAFGHTRFFRLPYEKTIGAHIPHNLKNEEVTDFADAIFGKEGNWASRVFFEDADLIDNPDQAFLPKTSPKILASPKPTTFQHYLEQPDDATKNNLRHWDSDAKIRGYKMYWHRNTPNNSKQVYSWNEGKIIENDTQHTVIRPVNKGVTFKGRIRFENLTKEELGALLFVLNLPENCHHKLGMGKPLGLGSIKISTQLFISKRTERYSRLFDNNNDNFFLSDEPQKPEEFICAFEKYILNNISNSDKVNAEKLWETPRLKDLKNLLNWDNTKQTNWNEKTRYMEIEHNIDNADGGNNKINEFKDRPVLPRSSIVVNQNNE